MAPNIDRWNLNRRAPETVSPSKKAVRTPPIEDTQTASLPRTLSAPALLNTPSSPEPDSPGTSLRHRWLDAFERISPKQPKTRMALRPSTPLTRKFLNVVQSTNAAKDLIGTADTQFAPGVREYLFPEPISPLKGIGMAKKLLTGKRGLAAGCEEMVVEERVGRGFGKILSSVVFFPFAAVAMVVDAPRFVGAHLIQKSNQAVMKGVVRGGRRGSLLIVAGGLGRIAGGLCKLAVPVAAVFLGCFAGGAPGIVAAVLFETVYFGEDITLLLKGDFEEMTLFRGLADIVGGLSIMFGAEHIWRFRSRGRAYLTE